MKIKLTTSPTLLGVMALTMTAIIGGTSFSLSKFLMEFFNSWEFVTYRFFLGSLTLVLLRPSSIRQISLQKLKLALPTAFALSFAMLTLWEGVKYSDTGLSAFIANSEFVLIPAILYLFFGQKISLKTLLLVVTGVFGMALLSFKSGVEVTYGTILLFICATCFALYAVLNTELTKKLPTYEIALMNLSLSTLICGVFALFQGYTFKFNSDQILPLIYLGPLMMGIRFFFITYGQSKVKASHSSLIYLCEPVTATLIGCFILNETLTNFQLIGIVILISTVVGSFEVVRQEEGQDTKSSSR